MWHWHKQMRLFENKFTHNKTWPASGHIDAKACLILLAATTILAFHCLSLTCHCLSLTFHCLFTAFSSVAGSSQLQRPSAYDAVPGGGNVLVFNNGRAPSR